MINIYVIGISHKTAPIEIREQVSINNIELISFLDYFKEIKNISEHFVISTCNRTEFYLIGKSEKFFNHIYQYFQSKNVSQKQIYKMNNEDAITHLFKVVCGMDSMALGETQILHQCKKFYTIHQKQKAVKKHLHKLIQKSFEVSKKIRSKTNIGQKKTSIASIAVDNAKQHEKNLKEKPILLIGAGETIQNIAFHLKKFNTKNTLIINRSDQKAQKLAEQYKFLAMPWKNRLQLIQSTPIIFLAVESKIPIIEPEMLDQTSKQLIIDVSIPRSANPDIAKNSNKTLINIDQLNIISNYYLSEQKEEFKKASQIIQEQTKKYWDCFESSQFKQLIINYQKKCNQIKQNALNKGLKQLKSKQSPEHTLNQTIKTLTQQLMHPTLKYLHKYQTKNPEKTLKILKEILK